ncbi:MAG: ureidoglycolate lyase [Eubacteriales bacterium]|nr:ureidoglycolate lyase [Eubacteriales bacterium]
MNMLLAVEAMTKDAFRPYGEVIGISEAVLSGSSENHDYWDGVAEFYPEGKHVCSFLRTKKGLDKAIGEMEQHRYTEEILVALDGDIVVTVAGMQDNRPDENTIRSFRVAKGSGVIMKPGIWHALPLSYGESSMMLVIFRANTSFAKDKTILTDIHFKELNRAIKFGV